MKSILNTFVVGLIAMLSISVFAQAPASTTTSVAVPATTTPAPATAPAVATPAPAVTPDAVTPATKPAIAKADVACGKGEKGVARATGENVTAFARCGKPAVAKKPAIRKPVPAKSSASYSDEPSRLRESALEIGRLRLELAKREGFTSSVITSSFGTSGGLGSTFETIKGGDRECVVYFNGVRITSKFVWGDSVATKQDCDVFAATVHGTHTQSAESSVMKVSVGQPEVAMSVTPQADQAAGKNHTCELKYNGQVVEEKHILKTTLAADNSTCKVWTDAKAKEKGWVSAK